MQRTGTCGRQLQRYGKFEQNIWLLVYVGLCNELMVSSFRRQTPKFTMKCLLASLTITSGQGMMQPSLLLVPCSLSQPLISSNVNCAHRASLRHSVAHWKDKIGHTTIDLGIAPKKLESAGDGDVKETDPMERLKSVRGHLVTFPLEFMCQEDLRPMLIEGEFYASPQVFH